MTKGKGESEQEEGNRNSIHVIKAEKVNKEKHTHSHELLFIVFSFEKLHYGACADTATGQCPAYFEKKAKREMISTTAK